MEKQPFYTEEFYKWSIAAELVFNKLIEKKLTAEFDMYASGTFLFMSVKDCPESREILSTLIADFDQYKAHFKDEYDVSEDVICLCGIHEDHEKYFGANEALMWDEERNSFWTTEAFHNDEDEYDQEELEEIEEGDEP